MSDPETFYVGENESGDPVIQRTYAADSCRCCARWIWPQRWPITDTNAHVAHLHPHAPGCYLRTRGDYMPRDGEELLELAGRRARREFGVLWPDYLPPMFAHEAP